MGLITGRCALIFHMKHWHSTMMNERRHEGVEGSRGRIQDEIQSETQDNDNHGWEFSEDTVRGLEVERLSETIQDNTHNNSLTVVTVTCYSQVCCERAEVVRNR